ncbi:glutamine/glutamate/polar amino acids ABC transporter ATP-binding protein [Halosimplex carlsbadense 2-9-1]|uniref:Glutamine/glutamate/polar amino acids ABC transporter ATP-binding protein n=1 Tax=Halosimplex carlsbadense 2-9-1 TaxID=797114 RepID=M0CY53_9EURY|nr:amino acid ABC transporter ATP-binding protein [Halosimplex carlsbadense]ELZ27533.1 glutamine/glutamate/polar amino acids ABC transporter ATP-binding protein [Halosimplex carlsbadense 2-9-1]
MGSDTLLEFDGIDKYFDDTKVLHDVSLAVNEAEVVVIIGPSGSGKSTLLRCANRLETVQSGEIRIGGIPIQDGNVDHLRQRIGMVFQDFNLFPHKTVVENITLAPATVKDIDDQVARERAMDLLGDVGLEDQTDSYPNQLSGGQQQRVAIARALAMEPSLMLFDEVTSALDPELVGEVLTVMRELAADGMTMVIVTHQMGFARDVGDRIVLMSDGEIAEIGETESFFTDPETDRAEQFLARIH